MQTTALPLPTRPVLPTIQSSELRCLTDDAYRRLAVTKRLVRQYAEELEVIIKSTHNPTEASDLAPKDSHKGLPLQETQ